MFNQGFASAERGGIGEYLQSPGQRDRRIVPTAQFDAEHATEIAHLAQRNRMSRMTGQAGIIDPLDGGMRGKEAGDRTRICTVHRHACRQ